MGNFVSWYFKHPLSKLLSSETNLENGTFSRNNYRKFSKIPYRWGHPLTLGWKFVEFPKNNSPKYSNIPYQCFYPLTLGCKFPWGHLLPYLKPTNETFSAHFCWDHFQPKSVTHKWNILSTFLLNTFVLEISDLHIKNVFHNLLGYISSWNMKPTNQIYFGNYMGWEHSQHKYQTHKWKFWFSKMSKKATFASWVLWNKPYLKEHPNFEISPKIFHHNMTSSS